MKAGAEWAIIGGTLVMLLLLLILFGYSHPHSDDFSYNQVLQQKGFYGGSIYFFQHNTGRFFSTALIFLSPLKTHNIAGYPWITASLFTCFIMSLFALLYVLLKRFLSFSGILSLGAFVLLVFCSFAPSLHEFCFWLSGEATYLAAVTLWFWGIALHLLLLQDRPRNKFLLKVLTLLITLAISGVSESGIFLYTLLLLGVAHYRRKHYPGSNRFFYGIAACFLVAVLFVLTAAGSLNRFGQTPFSGTLLLAIGGGLYASGYWLAQWLLILFPATLLYLSVWGRRLSAWSVGFGRFRMFRAKNVVMVGLSFFVLCQIAAVWMSGSMPEERFENVLFLFMLLLSCLAAQLFFEEQSGFFAAWSTKAEKRTRMLAMLYFASLFAGLPNNYGKTVLDVCSGAAAGFDRENRQRYAHLAGTAGDIAAVAPINHRPMLLYYPALSCDSIADEQDIPRLALANYFGKKWIYEYPCSPEAKEYSLKEILKQKRQDFFPARSQ